MTVLASIGITVATVFALKVFGILAMTFARSLHEHLHAEVEAQAPPTADVVGFRVHQDEPAEQE